MQNDIFDSVAQRATQAMPVVDDLADEDVNMMMIPPGSTSQKTRRTSNAYTNTKTSGARISRSKCARRKKTMRSAQVSVVAKVIRKTKTKKQPPKQNKKRMGNHNLVENINISIGSLTTPPKTGSNSRERGAANSLRKRNITNGPNSPISATSMTPPCSRSKRDFLGGGMGRPINPWSFPFPKLNVVGTDCTQQAYRMAQYCRCMTIYNAEDQHLFGNSVPMGNDPQYCTRPHRS